MQWCVRLIFMFPSRCESAFEGGVWDPSERGTLLGAVNTEVEQLSSRDTKPCRAARRNEAVFPWLKRLAHPHFENSRSNLLNLNSHRVLRARAGLPTKSRCLPYKQLALFFVA